MGERDRDTLQSAVERMAREAADRLGLEVVEVKVRRSGKYSAVRVDLDRSGTAGVTLEECRQMTEAFSPMLDDSGLLEFQYTLEISSPGLERPIRTDDDVRRNTGRRIEVETTEPIGGRRSFRGVLLGLEGDALRVEDDDDGERLLDRGRIARAHQEIDAPRGPGKPRKRRPSHPEAPEPHGIVKGRNSAQKQR